MTTRINSATRFYTVICVCMLCIPITLFAKSEPSKPNIILINVDDLGWKDLGFMGSEFYETPNIDSLASRGMVFTNGYAAAANCTPSRACLFTGKWTPRHGIYTVGKHTPSATDRRALMPIEGNSSLSTDHITIAQKLAQLGYTTCHSGKWHLSEDPLDFGFDINIAGGSAGAPDRYYPPYKNIKISEGKNTYLTDLITEKTLEFVDSVQQPFFLNYAPYAVHKPLHHPAPDLIAKYLDKLRNKTSDDGQNNANYATMIENLDMNIGLLITKLEEKNLLNNTLLIFTSDNGGDFNISSQHPLRAGKSSYYEGGIRVPFFFVWHNKISADMQSDLPIANLDIFPTILKFLGVNGKRRLDGANLSPILFRKKEKLDRPLFWHFPVYTYGDNSFYPEYHDPFFRTSPGSVVRKGNWKLHYYFEDNEVELYDLEADIGERHNLAEQEPIKVQQMLQLLKKWWDETGAPLPREVNSGVEELE